MPGEHSPGKLLLPREKSKKILTSGIKSSKIVFVRKKQRIYAIVA